MASVEWDDLHSRTRWEDDFVPQCVVDDMSYMMEGPIKHSRYTVKSGRDLPIDISPKHQRFLISKHKEYPDLLPIVELKYILRGVSVPQVLSIFKLLVFTESDKLEFTVKDPTDSSSTKEQRRMGKRESISNETVWLVDSTKTEPGSGRSRSRLDKRATSLGEEWKFEDIMLPIMEESQVYQIKESSQKKSGALHSSSSSAHRSSARSERTMSMATGFAFLGSAVTSMMVATGALPSSSSSSDSRSSSISDFARALDVFGKIMNMPIVANETWRVAWDSMEAISIISNETLRSLVSIDEYSQIYRRVTRVHKKKYPPKSDVSASSSIDDSTGEGQLYALSDPGAPVTGGDPVRREPESIEEVVIIKRLFLKSFLSFPDHLLAIAKSKYIEASNFEFKSLFMIIKHSDAFMDAVSKRRDTV